MKHFYISIISLLLVLSAINVLFWLDASDYARNELKASKEELQNKVSSYIKIHHEFIVNSDTDFEIEKVKNHGSYKSYTITWDSQHWNWRVFKSVFADGIIYNYLIAPSEFLISSNVEDSLVNERLHTINRLEFERVSNPEEASNLWYWDFCDSLSLFKTKYHEMLMDTTYCEKHNLTYWVKKKRYPNLGTAVYDSIFCKQTFLIKTKSGVDFASLKKAREFFVIILQSFETILILLSILIVFSARKLYRTKRIQSEYDKVNSEAITLFDNNKYSSQETKNAARNLRRQFDGEKGSWKYKEFIIAHQEEIVGLLNKDSLFSDVNSLMKLYPLGFNEYIRLNHLYSDLSKWQEDSLKNILCDTEKEKIAQFEHRIRIDNNYRSQITNNHRRTHFLNRFYNSHPSFRGDKEWILDHITELDLFINKTISDFTSRVMLSYPLGYEHYKMYYGKSLRYDYEILEHENIIKEKHAILVEWEKLKKVHPEGKIVVAKDHSIESLVTPYETFGLYDKNILNISKLTQKLRSLSITYKNDAYYIGQLLKNNQIDCFYHFTDVRNIPLIKDMGGLCSWHFLINNGVNIPFQGGDEDSMRYDKKYRLEDYVRLSFCTSHPMEHRLRTQGANLVVLRISSEVAKFSETLFSDINAADSQHSHGGKLEDLLRVNIGATRTGIVSRDDVYFKLRQAEVMVKTFIPSDMILNFNDL